MIKILEFFSSKTGKSYKNLYLDKKKREKKYELIATDEYDDDSNVEKRINLLSL